MNYWFVALALFKSLQKTDFAAQLLCFARTRLEMKLWLVSILEKISGSIQYQINFTNSEYWYTYFDLLYIFELKKVLQTVPVKIKRVKTSNWKVVFCGSWFVVDIWRQRFGKVVNLEAFANFIKLLRGLISRWCRFKVCKWISFWRDVVAQNI